MGNGEYFIKVDHFTIEKGREKLSMRVLVTDFCHENKFNLTGVHLTEKMRLLNYN